MSSRSFRRTAALVVAMSFGMFSVQPAQASRSGSIIQGEISLRTLLQNMRDALHIFPVTKSDPPPPNNPPQNKPGNDPSGPTAGNREGSAGCPLGPPKGPVPPNGGGSDPGPAH
jgi:hypothetical protein